MFEIVYFTRERYTCFDSNLSSLIDGVYIGRPFLEGSDQPSIGHFNGRIDGGAIRADTPQLEFELPPK